MVESNGDPYDLLPDLLADRQAAWRKGGQPKPRTTRRRHGLEPSIDWTSCGAECLRSSLRSAREGIFHHSGDRAYSKTTKTTGNKLTEYTIVTTETLPFLSESASSFPYTNRKRRTPFHSSRTPRRRVSSPSKTRYYVPSR